MTREETLKHYKENICKHCCEWKPELRHCENCPTAVVIKALQEVELPCKIGDTVYTNRRMQGYYMQEKNAPYPYTVCFIGINESADFGGGFVNALHKNGSMQQFNFNDFGEIVFLNKAEAIAEQWAGEQE